VDVIDSGPGVAAAAATRIFDRFDRGGRAAADEGHGSGLGLAIAKWAVEVSGGRLSLENAGEGGSTVRIPLRGARRQFGGRRGPTRPDGRTHPFLDSLAGSRSIITAAAVLGLLLCGAARRPAAATRADNGAPASQDDGVMTEGARLYEASCSHCHDGGD